MADVLHSFDLALDNEGDNKNFEFHKNLSCSSKVVFHKNKISFTDAETQLSAEQRLSLLNFFFVKTLSEKEFRDEQLKRTLWVTSDDKPATNSLYKALIKVAGLTDSIYYASSILFPDFDSFGFYMFDANNIKNGVASCCVEHPRAILARKIPELTAKLDSNMKVNVSFKDNKEVEPKIQCLFRHLRNAIAHDNTYFIGDKVLFIDYDPSGRGLTGAVLLSSQTLFDWITLVNNGRTKTGYVLKLDDNSRVLLHKIDEHPLLMQTDFNLWLKSTDIKIEKRVTVQKKTSWADTKEIVLTPQNSINTVNEIIVKQTTPADIIIGDISNPNNTSGKYRITIPMKFSSLHEKDARDESLFLFINF